MTHPRPDRQEFERVRGALLRSATSDAPSPQTLKRTLAAVGLGGAVAAEASSVAASSVARTLLLKWFGVGIVVGLSTIGATRLVGSATPHRVGAPPASQGAASPLIATTVVQPPADSAKPSASTQPAPRAVNNNATVLPSAVDEVPSAPSAAMSVATLPGPSALQVEIGLIDEARKSLASGDLGGSMNALDRHGRECKPAQLGHEASILRVETLARRGDCAGAQGIARQFVAATPKGPLAVKAKALVLQHCGVPVE